MSILKKMICSLLCLAAVSAVPALADDCGAMPAAYHEFAVFGKNTVYLSHFPMFSSAHAYQVILEVALKSPDQDAEKTFLDFAAQHPGNLFVFSPYRNVPPAADRVKDQDDWVLPEMSQVGKSFNGDIHYRANKVDNVIVYNVAAEVKRVIQMRMFDPKSPRPDSLSYILFGNGADSYLAHYVTAPPNPGAQVPDFDQILSVNVTATGKSSPDFDGGIYSLPNRKNEDGSRLKAGDSLALTGVKSTAPLSITVGAELFDHQIMTDR